MTAKTLDILIAEDEVIIARTLNVMLHQLGFKEAKVVNSFEEAERTIEQGETHLAILDINLNGAREGLDLGKCCKGRGIPFFYITAHSDEKTIVDASQTEPGAFLIKPFTPEEIFAAIQMTLTSGELSRDRLTNACSALGISDRESEILFYLKEHLTNSEIASKMFISINTVKYHIKRLFEKLNVKSRAEAITAMDAILDSH